MRVLVTGGAGYIGSQMVRQLVEHQIDVVVVDSLENGHRAAVAPGIPLMVGNIGDETFLRQVFARPPFDAVMHFAGYIEMKESMGNPAKYFRNNVAHTNQLLDAMVKANVKRFVFSSSAGVYGDPSQVPIPEYHRTLPTNPYGESKLMVEKMLAWYDAAHDMRSISLRYFNASGAMLDGTFGEDHPGESHIIPLALKAARLNQPFPLFGDDYPTRDGTCIRDYIHIIDLCDAHLCALNALMEGHATTAYNVGIGRGYSNREIARGAQEISGIDFPIQIAPRRPGDASESVADSSRLREELGWAPRYSDLKTIVGSAWKWHQSHPNGYGDR
ncbi:MAG: UDP-glucose 4-epimerase GalE [Chloroflexota bacterium]|nr:UDP-glucose 4-epimerase GalE [Chloroflexota bacterium]